MTAQPQNNDSRQLNELTDRDLVKEMDAASRAGNYQRSHDCYSILDRRNRTGTEKH